MSWLRVGLLVSSLVLSIPLVSSQAGGTVGSDDGAPDGFFAASMTTRAADVVYLLGDRDCGDKRCPVLLRGRHGGKFRQLAPPPVPVSYPCAKPCGTHIYASQVAFATRSFGYLAVPYLFMTRNSGRDWHRVRGFHGLVDVLASPHSVVLVGQGRPRCKYGCDLYAWRARPGSTTFTKHRLGNAAYVNYDGTAAAGRYFYVLLAGSDFDNVMFASSDGGRTWVRRSVTCPAGQAAAMPTAAPRGVVWVICEPTGGGNYPDYLLTSLDAGRTWGPELQIPHGSEKRESTLDIAAASPTDGYALVSDHQVVVTHNAGVTWEASLSASHDLIADVEAANAADIYALGLDHLYRSADSGGTWTRRRT